MTSLNHTSPAPLYSQLAKILIQEIRAGSFLPGDKIPSENVLSERHSIGRPTVRQATDLLIRRGYLERRRGSGTFVCDRKGSVDLFSLGGTLSSFNRQGIELSTSLVEPARKVQGEERPVEFPGGPAYRLRRIGSVEGEPVLLETFWVDQVTFPHLDEHCLEGRSLSELVLDEYGAEATGAEQAFRVARLDEKSASLLGIASTEVVLEVARTIHFQRALRGVYALMHCRSGQFSFSQKLGTAAQLTSDVGEVR